MKAAEIRSRFLEFFRARGHELLPSASLVPSDDPTLLFTNAGMVQFKKIFLGEERTPYRRAVTAQKCVRAGGKHNDLEQVGLTARHHTFFEMLGNFSFGDYFKEEAITFAWEFVTGELGLEADRFFITVHETDEEAFRFWRDVAGLPAKRIFRLGDRDNFWQMADTGPCGPCSELHYDLRPKSRRKVPSGEEFEALGEVGELLELWNLVFMQFDRDPAGKLTPLPAPSIDTGAGLERLSAVLQGADSNYDTDLFLPLLDRVASIVGRPYRAKHEEGVSYRVLADHARAVAFLLADGVLPSSEGRGYVLRRILRRGVRHAWHLGLRDPVLVDVVEEVIGLMRGAYQELGERTPQVLTSVRREEERFLVTIEGGIERFDQMAPVRSTKGAKARPAVVSGADVFKLYDTFGFPFDLTQVMARERGYEVDEEGFEKALEEQRSRSRADRAVASGSATGVATTTGVLTRGGGGLSAWTLLVPDPSQEWIGWDASVAETAVQAFVREDGRVGLIVRENPFYAEAGGQVSDTGTVDGDGWRLTVEEVRRVEGRSAVFGRLEGGLPSPDGGPFRAVAKVAPRVRHDTERNHTATHLLHAALRKVLGEHVAQRGSLVHPERLRFDFSHPDPLTAAELEAVEGEVNEATWADHPVQWRITSREAALATGAMALFGEKYGEEVRVVKIPGVSLELCGGTHLRHTGEIGLFRITRESGVAAGVRRIEALTGPMAFARLRGAERELEELSRKLKTGRDVLFKKVDELIAERERLEGLLSKLRQGGSGTETLVHEALIPLRDGRTAKYQALRVRVSDAEDARALGDALRTKESLTVTALAAESPDEKTSLFVFVTDDLVGRGVKAGALVREIAAVTGGRGGGKPHMAQGGVEDPLRVDEALVSGEQTVRRALAEGSAGGSE
ncbi:MAG: alanine--tRNA ligase [Gemmatimonadetes bacterium]|nr:alanine--tRNA ligase [Gemmatimonadota bacterium]